MLGIGVVVGGLLTWLWLRTRLQAAASIADRNAVNIAIAEQNRETVAQALNDDLVEEGELEVDAALLADVTDELVEAPRQMTNRWISVAVAFAIPLLAILLYWIVWGRPGTLLLQEAAIVVNQGLNESNANVVATRLHDYLAMHPDDTPAWLSLLSLQWLRGDREQFRMTHAQAERLGHTSAYTDSLYLLDAFRQRQMDLTSADQRVRNRLRQTDEDSPVGAMLDAFDHVARNDPLAANRSFETILSQTDRFELHGSAELAQRASRARLMPLSQPTIKVHVSLEQPFPQKNWLFVYARVNLGEPPLAVVKRPLAGSRRFEVHLDESVLMQRTASFADLDELIVTARLSNTADALAQADDITLSSAPVRPKDRSKISLAFGQANPLVRVEIRSETTVSPIESVFIIVRDRAVSAPPIAVRRVFGPLPKDGLDVTLADVMLPTINTSELSDLIVSARLSKSNSALARPGDIESDAVATKLGETVALTLDQIVGDVPRD